MDVADGASHWQFARVDSKRQFFRIGGRRNILHIFIPRFSVDLASIVFNSFPFDFIFRLMISGNLRDLVILRDRKHSAVANIGHQTLTTFQNAHCCTGTTFVGQPCIFSQFWLDYPKSIAECLFWFLSLSQGLLDNQMKMIGKISSRQMSTMAIIDTIKLIHLIPNFKGMNGHSILIFDALPLMGKVDILLHLVKLRVHLSFQQVRFMLK